MFMNHTATQPHGFEDLDGEGMQPFSGAELRVLPQIRASRVLLRIVNTSCSLHDD